MKKLEKTFKINPLYETDGYKVGHHKMLAPGTTKLYGTWIPRSLKYMPGGIDKIMSAGQQLVVRYLHSTFAENFFFKKEREEAKKEAIKRGLNDAYSQNAFIETATLHLKEKAMKFISDMSTYLGIKYDGKHFEELWDLGYLPIKIKALPEGVFTEPNIPHMTFVNTVDGFAWLTLFLETYISKLAWQMPIAATIAHKFRSNANEWVAKTDPANMGITAFMCHDFHSRGGNPFTSVAVGLGHAISNLGSDTLNVIPASRYYYDEAENSMPIYSVNASEHSVSTTKIFTVGEQQMIADWIKLFPTGILSIVSDTFDLWKLITEYLPANKEAIMARDGKLVIRPDSGDPVDIICGEKIYLLHEVTNPSGGIYKDKINFNVRTDDGNIYKVVRHFDGLIKDFNAYRRTTGMLINVTNSPKLKGVIELLWDIFGGTINKQGYKVLDSHIGAIYGDSINLERQVEIYKRLKAKGFAATNVVLGVGSFTYVMLTRDSAGYAAKGSWFEVQEKSIFCGCREGYQNPECEVKEPNLKIEGNGRECKFKRSYNIYKDPITDDGQKRSLKGLLCVLDKCDCSESEAIYCGEKCKSNIYVKEECDWEEENKGLLKTIYENGNFFNQTTLTEIRNKVL